jgi:hypothetical protein
MLVPAVVRRLAIDDDVLVRRQCERNMHMKTAAVAVFVTRRDHSHTTSDDVVIVLFEPFNFMRDRGPNDLGSVRSLKCDLQWDLHDFLRQSMIRKTAKTAIHAAAINNCMHSLATSACSKALTPATSSTRICKCTAKRKHDF